MKVELKAANTAECFDRRVVSAGDGEVAISILKESAGSREAALGLRDQLTYLALAQTAMPSSRTFLNTEKSPRSASIP